MKTAIIVLICLLGIALCMCVLFIEHQNQLANQRALQSEIKALEAKNKCWEGLYKLRGDSLQNAFTLLSLRNDTIKQADKITKVTVKDHAKIHFVANANDSLRHRKLSNLFHSYPLPR